MRATVSFLLALSLLASCSADEGGSIEIAVVPERQWYHTQQEVTLAGFVSDRDGNALNNEPVHWTVSPPDAATIVVDDQQGQPSANFILERDGLVTFTGCRATRSGAARSGPCGTITLRVDDGSPALELTAPSPGQEIDDAEGIRVAGSVTDAGDMRVFVADQLVELDELGQFETVVPASFGVNHVSVVASDGITEESAVEMDVLWAPAFAPATGESGTPEQLLQTGVAMSMGQRLFDDGQPLDPSDDGSAITTYDLADLLELVVSRIDILDRFPDPLVDESALYLRVPSASPGPVTAWIDVSDDGLELFVRLSALTIETEGQLTTGDTTVDLQGTVTASVAGSATIEAWRTSEQEPIHVELGNLLFAIETAQGNFAQPEAGAIFQLAEGVLRTELESRLLAAVEGSIGESVPELLGGVLGGLDSGLAGIEVVLDNEVFTAPVTLAVDGRIRSAFSRPGLEFLALLRTRIGTDTQSVFPDSRGVAIFDPGASDEPTFFRDRELQVGVRLAMLNGLLHSLWSSGLLEIDLSSFVPGTLAETARLSAKMPPTLRTPRPSRAEEAEDRFVLSLGQLEIELDLGDDQIISFGLTVDTAIDLTVADNAISVVAPGEPRLRIWAIETVDGNPITEDVVRALLLDQWPTIRDTILSGLSFDLPVPDTSGLTGLAPSLADLTLSVELLRPVYLRAGYVILEGALRGHLPAAATAW